MIRVTKLRQKTWRTYRDFRLEALRTEPSAFGSSPEEESKQSEIVWRTRTKNTIFAMSEGKPVGMLSYVFSDRIKTKHIVNIYGVYVTPTMRGRGIGWMLIQSALSEIRKNREIIKVQLSVNADLGPAIGLYKKARFQKVGRSRKELKVGARYYDMLLMEREIRKAST